MGAWIEAAQAADQLNPALPAELVLYALFAMACDPVLPLLKAGGSYDDEQLIDWMLERFFGGLSAATGTKPGKSAKPPPRAAR